MQSVQPPHRDATPAPPPITLPRLLAAFAAIPDPRRAHGRRFPLPALLALAVVALLSNHLSLLAIAQWETRTNRGLRGLQNNAIP